MTYEKYLYPKIQPYEKDFLKVDKIHQIYYEVSGNKNGISIFYIHGGPGGGTSENCRRYFDPKHYKIILIDQRGCGKSLPLLELKNNNTQCLIEDIEKIRQHLNLNKIILFGGSWGTTLSLLYAIKYPHNVQCLILRGVFLARKEDINWLYQEGASYLKPIEYERYISLLNEKQKKNIINNYHLLMNCDNEKIRHKAFIEWSRWEDCLISVNKSKFNEKDIKSIQEIALLENHFFYNNSFIEENYILNNISKIKNIKTYIVHGELDLDCRPSGAYELHKKLPNSQLFLLPKTGHTQREVKITQKLIEITNMIIKDI